MSCVAGHVSWLIKSSLPSGSCAGGQLGHNVWRWEPSQQRGFDLGSCSPRGAPETCLGSSDWAPALTSSCREHGRVVGDRGPFLLSGYVSTCYKYLSQSPDHSLQLRNTTKTPEEREEHCCSKMYSFLLQMKFKAFTACLGLQFTMHIRNLLKTSLNRFLFFFLVKVQSSFPHFFFYLDIFLLRWEQRPLHLVQLQQLVMKMCRNCQWLWLFPVILLIPILLIAVSLFAFFDFSP